MFSSVVFLAHVFGSEAEAAKFRSSHKLTLFSSVRFNTGGVECGRENAVF